MQFIAVDSYGKCLRNKNFSAPPDTQYDASDRTAKVRLHIAFCMSHVACCVSHV